MAYRHTTPALHPPHRTLTPVYVRSHTIFASHPLPPWSIRRVRRGPPLTVSQGQAKRRAEAKLDHRVVADLPFFAGTNRAKKHRCAILMAEGNLNDRQVARELNIARSTLQEWKANPDFIEVREDYEHAFRAEVMQYAIANKRERMKQLQDLNATYWQIKDERAARYATEIEDTPESAMRGVFGDSTPAEAATGMLVRQPKIAANGKTVVEWAFDKSLDSAIKETLKQAAQEAGDDEQTLNVNHGGEVSVEIAETVRRLAAQYGTTEEEIVALAAEDDE